LLRENRTYATLYGLAQLHADLTPPLALGITAPATLSVINNAYSPNPFSITATVFNNGSATAENVELTLNLPEGLSLASGTPMQYIGDFAVGQERQISWNVKAVPRNSERTLTYSVDATASNASAKNVPGQIFLPSASPFILYTNTDNTFYHNFTGTSVTTPAIVDPINSVYGNYLHSMRDISISDRGLPIEFVRSYNSLSEENSSLGNKWTNTYNIRLNEYSNGVTFVNSDGRRDFFELQSDGNYVPTLDVLSKLQKNDDGTFSLTAVDKTEYYFDEEGKLLSVIDANNNTLSLAYDENGNLAEVFAPTGRKLIFETDTEGRIISITDPAGRIYAYTYDTAGDLVSATNPAGGVTQYAYGENHNLTSITDAKGNTVAENEYDEENRVVKQTDGRGNAGTFQYDTVERVTTYTSSQGGLWKYYYDESFRVTKQIDAAGNESLSSFDANNRLIAWTDQNGNTTSYEYDENGNTICVTDALGNDRTFSYDEENNLISSTDELGNLTSYTYDAQGNLIIVINPLGAETNFAYDAYGQLATATDALGGVITFAYDAQGNPVKATNAVGGEVDLEYNSANSLTERTDPNGDRVSMEYDSLERLTKITNALGNSSVYSYDEVGNVVEASDASAATTKYVYDANNNLISVTDAMGGITQYGYDMLNHLVTTTNAAGNMVQYENNTLGQVTKTTDSLGNSSTFVYDGAGNVTAVTTAEGKTVSYEYDSLNRLVRKNFSDGTSAQFAYDAAGNLTSAENQFVTYTYTYNALGLVTSFGDSRFGITTYAYDTLGRRTQTTNENESLRYGYDELSQLTDISDSANEAYTFKYDAAGRRTEFTLPNEITTRYTYDTAGQLQSLIASPSRGSDIFSEKYTYDVRGNRSLKQTDQWQTMYEYDPLARLTQAFTQLESKDDSHPWQGGHGYGNSSSNSSHNNSGDSSRKWEESYAYDSVGNRAEGPQSESYFYNQADELLRINDSSNNSSSQGGSGNCPWSWNDDGCEGTENWRGYSQNGCQAHNQGNDSCGKCNGHSDSSDSFVFSYDKNGNIIAKTGEQDWQYIYDDENRLIAAKQTLSNKKVNSIEYTYDPFGQRIQKKSYLTVESSRGRSNKQDEKTEQYRYDGEDIVAIYDGSGELQMTFVHGPGIDEPLSVTYYKKQNSKKDKVKKETNYYTADALGSIVRLTDKKGNIVESYEYDSFGNFRDSEDDMSQPYAYTGREYDEETGLYYYRARYYDSSVGRFISKDPIVGFIEYPSSQNRYSYVTNNPARYVDPFGLSKSDVSLTGRGSEVGILGYQQQELGLLQMIITNIPSSAGICVNGEGGIGALVSAGGCFVVTPGGIGIVPNAGFLGSTGGSVGWDAQVMISNAKTVKDYEGLDITVGGSAKLGGGVSADYSYGTNGGWSLAVGGGEGASGTLLAVPVPAEFHGGIQNNVAIPIWGR